jgi:hypothetical protein
VPEADGAISLKRLLANASFSGVNGGGKGFIAWNPSATDAASFNPVFVGTARNGIVEVPVTNVDNTTTNSNNYALLGNPYPSSIDAREFVSHPNNTHLDGNLYLWSNNTRIDAANCAEGSAAAYVITLMIMQFITEQVQQQQLPHLKMG